MESTEACEVSEVSVGIAEAGNIDIHNVAEELPNAADDSEFNPAAADNSNENSGDGNDEEITNSPVADEVFHPHAPVHPVRILTTVPGAGGRATQLVAIVQQQDSHGTHHAHLVDGLKTPATPCTPGTPSGDKRQHYAWDDLLHSPNGVLPVRCRNFSAELHKNKLGSGGKGRCIKYQDNWYTPSEFESFCGRGNSKDWKRSIRYGGRTLNCLIEDGILTPHAASCTCGACCDDESVESSQSGPVRLFVPYRRRKRNESESLPPTPTMKRKMKLKDAPEEARSISLDSTASQLDVAGNLVLSPMPPGTPKVPVTSDLEHEHWWHLEEMANQLAQNVQQLKTMIEQAKAQAQTNKENAILHTKIVLDAEKKEALSQARLEAQMQFSRALMEAKAEKDSAVAQALAQARAEKMEAVANAKTSHLIKACVNCGREALLECMGCQLVSYCSSFCQRKDWASHQHNCGQHGLLAASPIEQHENHEDEETAMEHNKKDSDQCLTSSAST